jgi:hypothetical protein
MNDKYPYIWLLGTLTVALISFISAAIGAWISSRLSRKAALEQENRTVRRDVYRGLYFAIIEMAASGGMDPDDAFFKSFNAILLHAPDSLLKSVVTWKRDLDAQGGKGALDSPLMRKVLDEMRKDLGLSKKATIYELGFRPVGRNTLNKAVQAKPTTAASLAVMETRTPSLQASSRQPSAQTT